MQNSIFYIFNFLIGKNWNLQITINLEPIEIEIYTLL